jgi:hypothetical protein
MSRDLVLTTSTIVSETDLPRLASIEISSRVSNPLDQAKFPLESQLSQSQKQGEFVYLMSCFVADEVRTCPSTDEI